MTAVETAAAPDLSVIIPAFNEAARLVPTLTRIMDYFADRPEHVELLVCDDGSTDGTATVAADVPGVQVLRAPHNQGKGAALRRGVLASSGRHVLLTDADLSTPIEDYETLLAHADGASLVFGSRAVGASRVLVRQPLHRELMGKTFNKIIRLAGVHGISDTQCGFKLLDGAIARQLFNSLVTPGFAYDVELAWLAHRAGHAIAEVGVIWRNSPDSRVRPIRDAIGMLTEIVRFRWRHRA